MAVNFLIKHRSSGKYFHSIGGNANPDNDTAIVVNGDLHKNMYWAFEQIDDHWGYIKHVSSSKIIHPKGCTPGNGTGLLLHSNRHRGALFALDEVNNHVIHKGGHFAHPQNGKPDPDNDTPVLLRSNVDDGMKFQFVSTSDPNKEILVYGKPKVSGKWKIINMVLNPIAEHTDEFQIKIGRPKTKSIKPEFMYKWEKSAEATIEMFKASTSPSIQSLLESTASTTWCEEITRTKTLKVFPGKTVVTWQFVFYAEQNSTRAMFQSNLLADTGSMQNEPTELKQFNV